MGIDLKGAAATQVPGKSESTIIPRELQKRAGREADVAAASDDGIAAAIMIELQSSGVDRGNSQIGIGVAQNRFAGAIFGQGSSGTDAKISGSCDRILGGEVIGERDAGGGYMLAEHDIGADRGSGEDYIIALNVIGHAGRKFPIPVGNDGPVIADRAIPGQLTVCRDLERDGTAGVNEGGRAVADRQEVETRQAWAGPGVIQKRVGPCGQHTTNLVDDKIGYPIEGQCSHTGQVSAGADIGEESGAVIKRQRRLAEGPWKPQAANGQAPGPMKKGSGARRAIETDRAFPGFEKATQAVQSRPIYDEVLRKDGIRYNHIAARSAHIQRSGCDGIDDMRRRGLATGQDVAIQGKRAGSEIQRAGKRSRADVVAKIDASQGLIKTIQVEGGVARGPEVDGGDRGNAVRGPNQGGIRHEEEGIIAPHPAVTDEPIPVAQVDGAVDHAIQDKRIGGSIASE